MDNRSPFEFDPARRKYSTFRIGMKVVVDGKTYQCSKFEADIMPAGFVITITGFDNKTSKHIVKDWESFSASIVSAYDVDAAMATYVLEFSKHKEDVRAALFNILKSSKIDVDEFFKEYKDHISWLNGLDIKFTQIYETPQSLGPEFDEENPCEDKDTD